MVCMFTGRHTSSSCAVVLFQGLALWLLALCLLSAIRIILPFPFPPVSVLRCRGPIPQGAKAPESCHSSLGLAGPGVYLAILFETQCIATE